jgi:hypothetical protein
MLETRREYQAKKVGEPLSTLLEKFHTTGIIKCKLLASDQRDKIFGLLGLAGDVESLGILPNYLKSCREVYIDTARRVIQSGRVNILSMSQFPKGPEALPTWVPDWSAPIQKPYGDFSSQRDYFSASGVGSVLVIENNLTDSSEDAIALRGVLVDEIELSGSLWGPKISTNPQAEIAATSLFLSEVQKFCSKSSELGNNIYKDPQRRDEAPWRIPIGDREVSDGEVALNCRATSKSAASYQGMLKSDWWENMTRGGIISSNNQFWYYGWMDDMRNRRPFMSRKGYVGLGPAIMLPGDLICILFGAQVPYILRPSHDGKHTFVGEAYCDGIMDGEFMENSPPGEIFVIV